MNIQEAATQAQTAIDEACKDVDYDGPDLAVFMTAIASALIPLTGKDIAPKPLAQVVKHLPCSKQTKQKLQDVCSDLQELQERADYEAEVKDLEEIAEGLIDDLQGLLHVAIKEIKKSS